MPDILQNLIPSKGGGYIETGIISGSLGGGLYKVLVRGKEFTLRSAIDRELPKGSQVVINRTQYTRFIVGTTRRIKSQIEKEIVVDG